MCWKSHIVQICIPWLGIHASNRVTEFQLMCLTHIIPVIPVITVLNCERDYSVNFKKLKLMLWFVTVELCNYDINCLMMVPVRSRNM